MPDTIIYPYPKMPARATGLTIKYITKRDGRKEVFSPVKITRAIQAALFSTQIHDHELAQMATELVLAKLQASFNAKHSPTVEEVQDIVEQALMELNQYEVAKAYIVYRQERNQIRSAKSHLMATYQGIANARAKDFNLKRDNANVDGDTAMGKMLQFGAEGSKEFAKSFMMKNSHATAHDAGEIHVHDLDFFAMGTLTCCQVDVMALFENGFSTGHGHIRTPNSIASYAALAAIILQSNQNEQHGGQSIPNFDYALAKGVNKSFRRSLSDNLAKYNTFSKQNVKANFEEITLGDMGKLKKMKVPAEVIEAAQNDTRRQTFQAMEGLIHNLNTMHSRAGAQVPFTSINFGTDTTAEGRLVSESLLEAVMKGLGKGETAIFPISIFKVKEGINYNPQDPNYDLFKRAMEVSAKRLFPNFVFIDAPFNLQYYKKGDYRTEAVAMGCRTRVMSSVFEESDGIAVSRGNISFTTVNMPRIAIKHGIALGERTKADWDGFYQELDEKIELMAAVLLERFEVQAEKTVKNFPFLMGQGVWLGSDKLGPFDKLREVIKHGTLSFGFIGLAESLIAMMGEHHGQSQKAQKKGVEIIKFMREKADELSKRHNLNFSLLATPAEGIAGRFTKLDRAEFGQLTGITENEYYTNSFHVPVYYPIGAMEKIDKEVPYHALCNAGHITYVELDGDPSHNIEAFEAVIRYMKEAGVGYGSINHPVDRDPICGYSGVIDGENCPHCGRRECDGELGFERLRRITGYLVGSLERWNDAKQAEEKDRLKHKVEREVKKGAASKNSYKV
ncbi:anaerobic ribonucleoside triphosphate reductase [Microgenomates group bacterium]|nr:anaerobic ribonucleoside triphosphate reductase [Microgenomates group bacterium]